MNREEIIDKLEIIDASQHALRQTSWKEPVDVLERSSALVIAKDRERLAADVEFPESFPAGYIAQTEYFYTADQLRDYGDRRAAAAIESCSRETNAAWKLMCEKMVRAEREACAQLSDDMGGIAACSQAIRARGQQ